MRLGHTVDVVEIKRPLTMELVVVVVVVRVSVKVRVRVLGF